MKKSCCWDLTSRALLGVLLLLAGVESGRAASWTNAGVGDWFSASNWEPTPPHAMNSAIIFNGGTAIIADPFAVALSLSVGDYFDYGGNGTLLVSKSATGSVGSLTTRSISLGVVGSNGTPYVITGLLDISGEGSVETTGTSTVGGWGVRIGESIYGGGPGAGSVNVSGAGSVLYCRYGPIVLGAGNATGTLVIQNGARAQAAEGMVGTGSVTVKGNGSIFIIDGLYLGNGGATNSFLDVLTGGLVKTQVLKVYNGLARIDNGSSTVAGLEISDVGSERSGVANGVLVVGDNTLGRMVIRYGGTVVTYRGFIGGSAGGIGSVLVESGKWKASGSIWVGNSGSGTLDVQSGGTVTSAGNGYLAFSNNTTGYATIDGIGSAWTMADNLYIGGNGAAPGGSGQLIIGNGGGVTAAAITLYNTGTLTLGANATLNGPLTAMGGIIETINNITFANNFTLGTGGLFVRTHGFNSTFNGAISGSGSLTKSGSFTGSGLGTLTLAGNSTYSGPTTISVGKLVVNGSIASAVTVGGNTTLAGSGTVGGIIIQSSGVLAPGNSPGKLAVNGDYTQQSGGVLNVEIGGATPGTGFDQVAVSGNASVDGILNLSLVNGFRPSVGQTFAIITSSSETGNFSTINSSGFTVRSDASATGIVLTVTSVVPTVPVITSSTSASGTQDQPFSYQITATESPTSFGATALPAGLSANTATGVISGTPTTVGSLDVTISATNSTATGSATLTITITPPGSTPGSLANISTRLRVETGDNALIGGFIVTGTQPKRIIVRGIGTSLPFDDRLANPTLELRDGSGALLDSNDNWVDSPNKQAIIDSTIPPSSDLESAIVATVPANSSGYTAIVRGIEDGTGIGVVEAYDLDNTVDSKLANISTRGFVQTSDNVLIAGTIIVGEASQNVLVRAIGPSLPVPGKMEDPTLELRDGNGGLIEANDNWVDSPNKQAIIDTTIPPSNDLESAIVATLPANNASYTAIVRGVNDTTGIAVVEVYALN